MSSPDKFVANKNLCREGEREGERDRDGNRDGKREEEASEALPAPSPAPGLSASQPGPRPPVTQGQLLSLGDRRTGAPGFSPAMTDGDC